MALTSKDHHQVLHIIMATVDDETPTNWFDIVEAIKAKMEIDSWVDVRLVLQYTIHHKMIVKINDLENELYIRM